MKDVACGLYNICTTHVASDKDRDSWPPVISILVFWQLIPVTIDQKWKNVQILQIYLCYFSLAVLIFWLYTQTS